jgi:hypothetical protein
VSTQTKRFLLAALLLLATARQVWAQTTLELYDDFSRNRLHQQLWTGGRTGSAVDERREARHGELLLRSASSKSSTYALLFKTPAPITAVRARIKAPRWNVRSCAVSGYPLARSRVSIGGRFFASTSVSPQKDVGAFAELEMVDGMATTLKYRVQYCDDVECETGTVLHAGAIGTLPSFGKAKVLIDWDGAEKVFRFQVDTQSLVTVGYKVNDSATLSLERKGIQITHAVPTCPAGSHPEGGVQAWIDDVWVTSGARPTITE